MKIQDHYDWIVLGDSPGALMSAALVARMGLSVLVLPFGDRTQVKVSSSGQCFDPDSNFIVGLGENQHGRGLWSVLLDQCGLLEAEKKQILISDSTPQLLAPRFRCAVDRDFSLFKNEILRELPELIKDTQLFSVFFEAYQKHSKSITHYWENYPSRFTLAAQLVSQGNSQKEKKLLHKIKTKLIHYRSHKKFDQTLFSIQRQMKRTHLLSEEEQIFLNAILYATYGVKSIPRAKPSWQLLHTVVGSQLGAAYQGGLSSFGSLISRLAKRLGATIPEGAEAKRIFVSEGRFVGVQASHQGNMIAATGGILGTGLHCVGSKISYSGNRWQKKLKKTPQPYAWKMTLALTLHEDAFSSGMTRRMIWVENSTPPLEIEFAHPSEYGISQTHYRLLFLRTPVPFKQSSLDPKYQSILAARMFKKATELLPFLEFHVLKIFPDFRFGIEDFEKTYSFQSTQKIPENLRLYQGQGTGAHSGVDGLFLATSESFPEQGTLGPLLGALEGVAWLAFKHGLKGPFL